MHKKGNQNGMVNRIGGCLAYIANKTGTKKALTARQDKKPSKEGFFSAPIIHPSSRYAFSDTNLQQAGQEVCKTPSRIEVEGREVVVACRKCWQCKSNRVNDYVGRSIAQHHHSTETLALTLTYGGGDTVESAVLTYSHVQKFLKKVRKVYDVKYIVAGEYGSQKGRAHWHIILFFKGKSPEIVYPYDIKKSVPRLNPPDHDLEPCPNTKLCLDERMSSKLWEHGYIFAEKPSYAAFRYVLKYVLKDEQYGQTAVRNLGMSKQPPLGYEYFKDLAKQYVDQGLAPRNFEYTFPDEKRDNGERRKFHIEGKSRENFLNQYMEYWEEKYGTRPPVQEVIIEHVRKEAEYENDSEERTPYAEQINKKEIKQKIQKLFMKKPRTEKDKKWKDPLWWDWPQRHGTWRGQEVLIRLGPEKMTITYTTGRETNTWLITDEKRRKNILREFNERTAERTTFRRVQQLAKLEPDGPY